VVHSGTDISECGSDGCQTAFASSVGNSNSLRGTHSSRIYLEISCPRVCPTFRYSDIRPRLGNPVDDGIWNLFSLLREYNNILIATILRYVVTGRPFLEAESTFHVAYPASLPRHKKMFLYEAPKR
jgi:hypothetical protein